MGRRRNKEAERIIARRRIGHLLEAARRRLVEGEEADARRAVQLARRIAMRYQTGLRQHERDRICRSCGVLLVPGRTARVRVGKGTKRTTCLRCGHTARRGYRREQKARRLQRAKAQGEDSRRPALERPLTGGGGR